MVVDGLDVALEPESQSAAVGTAVTYTLVLTNHLETAETYTLTAEGAAVAGADVSLPPTVTVSAGSSESLPVTVTAAADGFYPFTIQAQSGLAADGDSAVLEATGSWAVEVALAPASAVGGPLTPAVFTVTVTNQGNLADSYDLDVALPAGWTHQFKVNGVEIDSLSLVPELFNAAEVLLLVTPPAGEAPGSYDVAVSAQSQSNSGVSDTADGTVQVQTRGVDVSITPASTTMLPTDSGLWQVTITNTGTVADSYWLTTTGFIGPFGDFSANPVALNAGQSATVQLTAEGLDLMLPATYPFGVGAVSQNNALIRNEAAAEVTFESLEAVAVGWVPAGQTVMDTLTAEFMMVITNSGNVATTYDLGLNLPAGVAAQMGIEQLWLPAHVAAHVLVSVEAEGPGVYLIEGTADSTTSAANGSSTATLEVVFTNLPPSAEAGGDQTADEGETVNFNGTANDPEGQPLEIRWDFGDGTTANGTLTPSHVYDDDGQFTVTLVVTDVTGLSDSDTLLVTVDNVAPMVEAGADQTAEVGDTVSLDPATFSDPGAADTHTATINWGDGTIEAGTVDQANDTVSGSHVYSQAGVYTVTVTVVDDDGGEDSDSFTVTIAGADTYYLYMPAVFKPN